VLNFGTARGWAPQAPYLGDAKTGQNEKVGKIYCSKFWLSVGLGAVI